jgi:hypothetical protein
MLFIRIILGSFLLGAYVHAATFASVLGPGRVKDIIHSASADVIELYRVKEVKVQISTGYEEFLMGAVVNLEAPKAQPEQGLQEGLKTFLTGAVEYLRKKGGDIRDNIIRLVPDTAGQPYIDSLKQKCRQEMPCPIPPCCGECQRCK